MREERVETWRSEVIGHQQAVKTQQTKSLLTNPAQRWKEIIFRQVNKGKRKNQILHMLERIDGINLTGPRSFPAAAGGWRRRVEIGSR